MSRSAAATARSHRVAAPPAPPRRVSGPLNPQPQRSPRARVDARTLDLTRENPHRRSLSTRPPLRIAAEGGLTIASAVAGVALDVSHSKLMDRLVRSRAWVVIVAFGLIGIVAMQVSMLKLNNGIGRAVETIGTLERSNAALRGEVSRRSSGDRIQSLAGARGFIMPAPADVTFLRAGDNLRSDGFRAAKRMRSPDASIAGPAGSAILPDMLTGPAGPGEPGATDGTGAPVAPVAGTDAAGPAGATPGAVPAPAGTAPAPAGTAPGAAVAPTTAPATTAPATTAPAPAAPVATPAAPAPSGGVTAQTATQTAP